MTFTRSTALGRSQPRSSRALSLAVRYLSVQQLVGLILILSALALTTQTASAQSFQIFIPTVATEGAGPGGSGSEPEECALSAEELAIATSMSSDSRQGRTNPVCDPILTLVARGRARDMALRGYFSHTNPDGKGPNILAREAGYPLPDWYSDDLDSNNIESIGGGYPSPAEAWQGWMGSPSHQTHVLGMESFYADQRAYGVGYYFDPNSPFKHYWVFLSAPIE
jgi:uncharacterized protein YkwD